jgi:hypothetical protein
MPLRSQLHSAEFIKPSAIRETRRAPRRRLAISLLAVILAAVAPACAWNDQGHMAVAYVAYQRLNPAVRKRADALLKLNPYYAKWLAAIPKDTPHGDVNRLIFMIAATWPDQIRSDPDYRDDGSNGGNTPSGPEAAQNIGYQDHLRHKYWHFIDVPYSQDGTKLPAVPTPNAETQIAAFRRALGSSASDDVKSYDLVWLEHLVGDIHQPLHAVTRVSAAMPAGDAGGSLTMLCASPCGNSLHLFWDRLVGSQSGIEAPGRQPGMVSEVRLAITAAQALPAVDSAQAAQMQERIWVQESFELAKQDVYTGPAARDKGPFELTPQYYATAKRVAEQRIALAGARLANLLNQELK